MFTTVDYTVENLVDSEMDCAVEQDGTALRSGLHAESDLGRVSEEAKPSQAEEVGFVGQTQSAPRRGSSPFFGAWTDTRTG